VDPYQWIVEVQPKYTEVDSWTNGLLSLGEYKKLVAKLALLSETSFGR